MLVTPAGIEIVEIPEPIKACDPILDKPLPIVTDARFVAPEKVLFPIAVTEFGIVTDVTTRLF
jgi:hypothetical protein